MANVLVFRGINRRSSIKKAVGFYYNNFDYGVEIFLARCRLQPDKITIHFYPNMTVDLKEFRKKKAERKKKK